MGLRRGLLAGVALAVVLGAPARAALPGPQSPPPPGCAPTPLAAVTPTTADVCLHRVLVTEVTNAQEQNTTSFTVTDDLAADAVSLPAVIGHWWPQGPPTAGMVVTLWGRLVDGAFRVDRWIELTHGTGPAPRGPYRDVRLLDVSAGRVPEHRMVWVRAVPFLLDPQDTGDGDIHVQTLMPCPGAGLTTETTPPLRGYVDHPDLGLPSSTNTDDLASAHLGDAPPVGVPVMILGATRYDYGFGWWELHPIRAWRFLTAAEALRQARDCAADPVPHLDPDGPTLAGLAVPVPFGVPPCTDGSEFGNLPGFMPCAPQCYVAHTAIGQPETLAGPCAGITPRITPSQVQLSERRIAPWSGASSVTIPRGPDELSALADGAEGAVGDPDELSAARRIAGATLGAALRGAYGPRCRALASRRARYDACLQALARLAGGETNSPRAACRREPDAAGERACLRAARRLAGALR